MTDTKALQVREKQEVTSPAEQTKPGPVYQPAVDIFETDRDIILLADMPGVAANAANIDLREDILTIGGDVAAWNGADETEVMIEFGVGKYHRQFTLSEAIDQAKIEARLDNGVLRLVMPKAQKAVPRRITVKAE